MLDELVLNRVPYTPNASLRAWDAADELLIDYVQSLNLEPNSGLLIINDQFGALSCALSAYRVQVWTDSASSEQAITENCAANKQPPPQLVPSTLLPEGTFDYVLIKVPKSNSLLQHQLTQLMPLLKENALVIAAGMLKQLHTNVFKLFEQHIGQLTTSLAKKKARLIFAKPAEPLQTGAIKADAKTQFKTFYCEHLKANVTGGPNVYSAGKLDAGARLMLQCVQQMPVAKRVIDLGCGNGVLGLAYQQYQPTAQLCFIDESYMAVASAQKNYQAIVGADTGVTPEFCVSNGLPKQQAADLILCNPPFHQGNTIGDHIAWQMFTQSYQALSENGQLWVVGNRHLKYHTKLKKIFPEVNLISSNAKFVVLQCSKAQ